MSNEFMSKELNYGAGCKDGYELGYSKGLDDAWEAARKIVLPTRDGGITWSVLRKIFSNADISSDILKNYGARSAVRRLDEFVNLHSFKVGDEVRSDTGCLTMVITYIDSEGRLYGLDKKCGCTVSGKEPERFVKTGRRYEELDKLMEAFRNEITVPLDALEFKSRSEAEKVLEKAKEILFEYGQVSVGDVLDICDLPHTFTDEQYGWDDLSRAEVRRMSSGKYTLVMPEPHKV